MDPGEQAAMPWVRAGLTAVALVAVAAALLVIVPNLVLTRISGLSRSGRVAVATLWFFAALGGLAWGLRRSQARHWL